MVALSRQLRRRPPGGEQPPERLFWYFPDDPAWRGMTEEDAVDAWHAERSAWHDAHLFAGIGPSAGMSPLGDFVDLMAAKRFVRMLLMARAGTLAEGLSAAIPQPWLDREPPQWIRDLLRGE